MVNGHNDDNNGNGNDDKNYAFSNDEADDENQTKNLYIVTTKF